MYWCMQRKLAAATKGASLERKEPDRLVQAAIIDPNDIIMCKRGSGEDWLLGAGSFGTVSTCLCPLPALSAFAQPAFAASCVCPSPVMHLCLAQHLRTAKLDTPDAPLYHVAPRCLPLCTCLNTCLCILAATPSSSQHTSAAVAPNLWPYKACWFPLLPLPSLPYLFAYSPCLPACQSPWPLHPVVPRHVNHSLTCRCTRPKWAIWMWLSRPFTNRLSRRTSLLKSHYKS